MKTIKHFIASFATLALFATFVTPAFAQSSLADAEFAHFDGAPADPVVVLHTIGDARTADAVSELRENPPSMTDEKWDSYAKQLELALSSDHDGIQNAALRLVIAYSDKLNLSSEAVIDVMRLYREGNTDQVRRMAVVSLSQINSATAMGFLRLSADFEKSDTVKSTILAVLNDAASVI